MGDSSILLRPLTEDEAVLLTTIHEQYMIEGRFPIFDFVERTLYRAGKNANELLATLPTIGAHALYGLVRPAGARFWRAEEPLELTMGGLIQSPRGQEDVRIFLSVIEALSEREQQIRPQPYDVLHAEVTSEDIARHLRAAHFDFVDIALKKTRTLLRYEPPDAISGVGGTDEAWSVSLSKDLRRYRGVKDAGDYLNRVVDTIGAAGTTPTAPRYPSPLGLSEAIDYLDVVWQIRFKKRLFRLPGATAIVKLSLPCSSEDEFRSRVSAICDVMARIDIPTSGDVGSLNRLLEFARTNAGAVDSSRLSDAIASLKAISDIRAGAQHDDARSRAIDGLAKLGLPYPPPGWDVAWIAIEARAVEALNAIREEIERESPA